MCKRSASWKGNRKRVEEEIAKYLPGWTIREAEWTPKNKDDKAPLLCPRGHAVDRKCNDIKRGRGCKECKREEVRKEEFEEFTAAAIAEGYEMLSTAYEYKTAQTKLRLRCPNGSTYCATKADFVSKGARCNCLACHEQKKKPLKRWTHETAATQLRERGEELLEPFKDARTPVLSRCMKCGYERKIRPDKYFRGKASCAKCSGRYKPTTEEYRAELRAKGWDLAPGAEYKGALTSIEHICPNGHRTMKTPNNWRRGHGCEECYRELMSERMSGENSPLYNPELTDEQRREIEEARRSPEYKRWRKAVLKRDGHRCVLCGSSHEPQAHHLYSFANYREYRYDVENGVTLCAEHHLQGYDGSFHSIYGNDGETIATQFLDYLEHHVRPGVDGVTEDGIRRARELALNIIRKVEGETAVKEPAIFVL